MELIEENPRASVSLTSIYDDITTGGLNRTTHNFVENFLDSINDEIAILLLAKDFLNSTTAAQMSYLAKVRRNNLTYHTSIAIVALVAIGVCILLLCCSFRYIGLNHLVSKNDQKPTENETSTVYAITSNDKSQLISSDAYRPHCFL